MAKTKQLPCHRTCFISFLLCSAASQTSTVLPKFLCFILTFLQNHWVVFTVTLYSGQPNELQTHRLILFTIELLTIALLGFPKGPSFPPGDIQASLPADLLSCLLSLVGHMQKYQEDRIFGLGLEVVLEEGLRHQNLQCHLMISSEIVTDVNSACLLRARKLNLNKREVPISHFSNWISRSIHKTNHSFGIRKRVQHWEIKNSWSFH